METNLSSQRIFEVISRDKAFFKHYLNDHFNRLLTENEIDKDYILALFLDFNSQNKQNIFTENLLKFADSVNEKINKQGFRNLDFPNDNQDCLFTPVKHTLVFQKLYSLLDCYRGLWKDLPDLEREAFFHIHLMRIYPFIYNNELISMLILNSNLINSYYPPIVISKIEKEDYYNSVNSGDALKFKELIIRKTEEELKNIIDLYKKYYLFPDNVSIEEIIIKKTNY